MPPDGRWRCVIIGGGRLACVRILLRLNRETVVIFRGLRGSFHTECLYP